MQAQARWFVDEHELPERQELTLWYGHEPQLSVGVQPDLYATYWHADIGVHSFVQALQDIGVPEDASTYHPFPGKRAMSSQPLWAISRFESFDQVEDTGFLRVTTPGDDFTWQRRPTNPRDSVVGIISLDWDPYLVLKLYQGTSPSHAPHVFPPGDVVDLLRQYVQNATSRFGTL